MRNPKTQLEIFLENGGRGDVLSMSKEDIARVYKLPKRIYAPIIHALMTWFMTGERVTLSDPRDDGMLEGFIEHQKANADKRREFLEKQLELANRSVASRKLNQSAGKPRVNHGSTMVKPRLNQVEDKEEDKVEVMNTLSSSLGLEKTRADAALFNPLSVEEAKKLSMMLAPPINADNYSAEDLGSYKELQEEVKTEDGAIKTVMSMTEEGKRDKKAVRFSRNTYRKFYRELGHDMFVRAFFRFDTNLYVECQKYDKDNMPPDLSKFPEDSIAKNPAASFTANLKRLEKAIAVMKESDLSDVSYG